MPRTQEGTTPNRAHILIVTNAEFKSQVICTKFGTSQYCIVIGILVLGLIGTGPSSSWNQLFNQECSFVYIKIQWGKTKIPGEAGTFQEHRVA